MMKNAGMSISAMYGGSGGGGTTAGSGGGSAPIATADGEMQRQAMGLQIERQAAELALMQAQTKKTEAEAVNIAGGEKDKLADEIESLSQGVKNMKAKEELDKAQTSLVNLNRDILSATKADAIKMVQEITREAFHRANIAASEYRDWETDRKSTRLNSSHRSLSRMPSSS